MFKTNNQISYSHYNQMKKTAFETTHQIFSSKMRGDPETLGHKTVTKSLSSSFFIEGPGHPTKSAFVTAALTIVMSQELTDRKTKLM